MGHVCEVDGCLSSSRRKDKRKFYTFPLDEIRCQQWIRAAGRIDLECKDLKTLHKNHRICDLHFVPSDHLRRNLRRDAVPSLNLPHQDAQNTNTLTSCTLTNDVGFKKLNCENERDINTLTKYTQIDVIFKCQNCETERNISKLTKYRQTDVAFENQNFDTERNTNKLSKYTQTDVKWECQNCENDINTNTLTKSTKTDVEFKRQYCETERNIPSTSKPNVIPTQTVQDLSSNTPRKRKLRDQLTYKNKRVKMLENSSQSSMNSESGFSSIVHKILNIQKHFKHKYEGNKYDREYRMFAMNIYFASPLAYKVLAKTLYLPSERTLRRTKIDIGTNFSDNVIRCLQSKIKNLSESEKICILCVDEMSLKRHLHYEINKDKIVGFHEINGIQNKEPATQAFVVMARGLFSKWKQPLAYCFLSQSKNFPQLESWLDDIITKVMEIGFKVIALTSDQGSNFISMAKRKGVTSDNPYFYVNGKKIYYIFDVPHLVKSLRNNLLKYDFIYNGADGKEEKASWKDVQNLYDIEKERSYQMAFKLTETHIRPNNFEKMKVRFAAQIFSRCVSTAIQCCVELKKLPEEALGTAKLLKLLNDMFDILNSSSCNEAYKYKRSFSQHEYQMEVLQNVLQFLKDVHIVQKSNGKDVTNSVKCLKGLEITIQSVINLSSDLRTQNHKFLFTRRLNQDVLENFFGAIRQQRGNCREPTPVQFEKAFRKLFLSNIIRHSEYANCAEDLDNLLVATEEESISKSPKISESESVSEKVVSLTVGTVDYRFDLPEENAFSYISGYLLKKCKEVHKNCSRMEEYVNHKGQVNSTNTLISMRAFDTAQNFGSVNNLQDNFKLYVKQMDEIVRAIFKEKDASLPPFVGNEILKNIDNISFADLPCECFPIGYLKKLFIRFRIFNIMTHNNRNFRDKSFRKKFFSVSHL